MARVSFGSDPSSVTSAIPPTQEAFAGFNDPDPKKTKRTTNIYNPRMAAFLTVPDIGSAQDKKNEEDSTQVIKIPVRVRKAHLEFNDFNMADSARVEIEYMDAGLDPRVLRNAIINIYMVDAQAGEEWRPNDDNCRFIGILIRCERGGSEEVGLVLECEFHDYTTLFLQNTHYPTFADPSFDQKLSDIWAQICENTGPVDVDGIRHSTCRELSNRIKFEGDASDVTLGKAVAERFRSIGKFHRTNSEMDAWAIWQRCCDMLGYITFIRLDEVIVTTSRSYYSENNPTWFIWGKNILSIREQRNTFYESKGVAVSSFDPTKNQDLEAFYPPVGDPRVYTKRVNVIARSGNGAVNVGGTTTGGKQKKQGASVKASHYERFVYPGVTNPEVLQEIAFRIYQERSRQELEGTLTTVEMTVDDQDILSLQPGNVIEVTFEDNKTRTKLADIGSLEDQINYLVERGYRPEFADYMAHNLQNLENWSSSFIVKRVEIEFDSSENSGLWQASIGYHNRINIDGTTQ